MNTPFDDMQLDKSTLNPSTPLRFAGGRRDMSDETAAKCIYVGDVRWYRRASPHHASRRFRRRPRTGPPRRLRRRRQEVDKTGTAKTVIDRRTVTASFRGVILPGWLDCGCGDELPVRPFAAGTLYYSNRVNGFTTPASLEFNLNAP